MARKQQEPEFRFGEIRPDYEASLERYMLKAGLLANAVSTVLTLDDRIEEMGGHRMTKAFREQLQKALDEFMAA